MPSLNWSAFAALPGAAETNFEMLCRAIVRRQYSRSGEFLALANQPGVEFHLRLEEDCDLDRAGRWYGWQCRWYGLASGKALGTTRKKKIEKALLTTARELPAVTDWVLWTRHPLTKGDQNWFKKLPAALPTKMKLWQWTAAEVDDLLCGPAEILRSTYFGELILTPDRLSEIREEAVEPICRRWRPEVHQPVDAERSIRRMLGESGTWSSLTELSEQLSRLNKQLRAGTKQLSPPLAQVAKGGIETVERWADHLDHVSTAIGSGDLDLLRQLVGSPPAPAAAEFRSLPRSLRSLRLPQSLFATNLLALCRDAEQWNEQVEVHLDQSIVAIVADAGCGKTQLAAQLTQQESNRPAGLLLHGRELKRRGTLDGLAQQTKLNGTPVASIELLIGALDAAGQRARHRLPLVIDGLNEAEDPRDWKAQLASLSTLLKRYPYVLVVVTLRSDFVADALPDDLDTIAIPDFEHDVGAAIKRYFDWYKIDPSDGDLPIDLLRHPLSLRLFCEVTNPTRAQVVGVAAFPGSLSSLFEKYLEQAARRISELSKPEHRFYEHDVRAALDVIGSELWDKRDRTLEMDDLRRKLADDRRPWDASLVRALEEEGILLKVRPEQFQERHYAVLYDALAGHLIASAVIGQHGRAGLAEWVADPRTLQLLAGPHDDQHPFASDSVVALTALTPRQLHRQQFWSLADGDLRHRSLLLSAGLESASLDTATVAELESCLEAARSRDTDYLFDRLRSKRAVVGDPLNASFLDRFLRTRKVAVRDALWTEWVRARSESVTADIDALTMQWKTMQCRSSADVLRATWVMWTLTSTHQLVRDGATRALYWFGRGDPAALFRLVLVSLDINDAYVPERMLAAAYGVVMAHQHPDAEFEADLTVFLQGLRDAFCSPHATSPTDHQLQRTYVEGMAILAARFHPSALPAGLLTQDRVRFRSSAVVSPIPDGNRRAKEIDRVLQMDFENYTVGRLFDDRRNYDNDHPGHRAAIAHIRGTAWALGWRQAGLGVVDEELGRYEPRAGRENRVERYGKKYSWIGFNTYAGMLDDRGELDERRLTDVHLDPSFPEIAPAAPVRVPIWARPTPVDDKQWVRKGIVTVPDTLLYSTELDGHVGPWVLVDGYLDSRAGAVGRNVFGRISALLVDGDDGPAVVAALNERASPGGYWLPEPPSDYYVFAGEIPWHPEFASGRGDDPTRLYLGHVRMDAVPDLEVEILSHAYAWESYHSPLNDTGGAHVPSRWFSEAFDLRGLPQAFDQVLPDMSRAALVFEGPDGFEGRLLYLREDLLDAYAGSRTLIWLAWGERSLRPYPQPPPAWLDEARRDDADVWRRVVEGSDLSARFAARAN